MIMTCDSDVLDDVLSTDSTLSVIWTGSVIDSDGSD